MIKSRFNTFSFDIKVLNSIRMIPKYMQFQPTYSSHENKTENYPKTNPAKQTNPGSETPSFRKTIDACLGELVCPLTRMLPHDPVTAEDGRLYEREAIHRWLREEMTSPVTRQPM